MTLQSGGKVGPDLVFDTRDVNPANQLVNPDHDEDADNTPADDTDHDYAPPLNKGLGVYGP